MGSDPAAACKDALREVQRLLDSGHSWVVDADLKAYFDSIPHAQLMQEVGRHIADSRVLELIEAFLKQDILEPLGRWQPEAGTPQGAVISPLLANLYLAPVDKPTGKRVCDGPLRGRHGDALSQRTSGAGGSGGAGAAGRRTGYELHPEKTRVVDTQQADSSFEFLGYRFAKGSRWPRGKSLKNQRGHPPADPAHQRPSLSEIVGGVNRTLRGWFDYFKHSNKWTFPAIDGWTRRRLRSILRRRSKQKGISGGTDHQRWPNRYFRDRGLFCLEESHRSLLQSS